VKRISSVTGGIVFLFSLGIYLLTLAPTVALVDSGELIVAARTLGVAHPPGFPLYVLLAHLASLVPLGSIALRVNAASALFGALAAAAAGLATWEALRSPSDRFTARPVPGNRKPKGGRKTPAGAEALQATLPPGLGAACALLAGLLFSASRTLWAYATLTEVYTLNTFLIALIFWFMLRWRRLVLENRRGAAPGSGAGLQPGQTVRRHDRLLNAAAFTFGLALGVHHVTVGLVLPACAALVLATEGRKFFSGKRLPVAAAFAGAGLCIYIYLPMAAARSPVMNWGDPRTFGRFMAHVTGWQYRVYFEARPELMGRQLADFGARLLREFGPAWLPIGLFLAACGLVFLWRHARAVFWFLSTAGAANLLYNINYEIVEDKDAYYLPVFLVMAVAAAFGARFLAGKFAKKTWGRLRLDRIAAAALLVILPGIAFAANYDYNNRRDWYIARDYVANVLSTVPPGGMLLTLDWQVYSPMLYLRELENYRRDAVVIDINQIRRSWYFDYLERTYPGTMAEVRAQATAFLADLRQWEIDPDLFQRNAALNRRISQRYGELILALVANHNRSAPVFVTQDIATLPAGSSESAWVQQLMGRYQLVPDGLVFRLYEDQRFHQPSHPALVLRGLNDGTLKFAGDDVVTVKVLPVYSGMSYNRGRYLASFGHHQEAIQAYQEALAIDPDFSAAYQAIAESQSALRRQ